MSGPFGSPQWMYSSGFYPHEIGNSARFDTNSYYARTPSSAGNRKTFTWSAWVKRSVVAANQTFFSVGSSSSSLPRVYWEFTSDDKLQLYFNPTGSSWIRALTTNALYRDPSSWYHIVIAIDTTQATGSNRTKLYVNGEQVTDFTFGAYLTQDSDLPINNTVEHNIGRYQSDANAYMGGYIAEVNFVDGQALDASYFGETKSGTWIPKKYAGSYGTNGYYLDLATRATDPLDASGNGNNFSSTNVVSTDWMLDSPTNNFATFNPLANGSWTGWSSYAEGALQIITPASGGGNGQCTIGAPSSGSWYWEAYVKASDANVAVAVGFCNTDAVNQYPTASSTSIWYNNYGGSSYLTVNGSNDSYDGSSGVAVGDIIGVSYDGTNVKFYKNNSLIWTKAYDATGLVPYITDGTGSSDKSTVLVNFGQDSSFAGNKTAQGNTDANGRGDFYYSPPSGHLALCTANLPDPVSVINPAVDNTPQDYFNTALYTGDGSSSGDTKNVDVGLDLDFVWIKNRSSGSTNHQLFDRVRGDVAVSPNLTVAEYGFGDFNMNSNNTIDAPYSTSAPYSLNTNNETYVAWALKAGGSGVSNTVGSLTSTVSANQDIGMSIVTFTTDGTNSNVGTGLSSSAPLDMVIMKRRNSTSEWQVGHRGSGQGSNFAYHTELNSNAALSGSAPYFMGSQSTSNGDRIYLASGAYGVSSATWVAYCFQEVEGFSKIGKYLGNGSTYGPIVYTGFRPAFVIIKRIGSSDDWRIYDNKRNNYNEKTATLYANHDLAEYTTAGAHEIDTTANGFRIANNDAGYNSSNTSSYLYIAFAEMPFKYANAR